MNKSAQHKKELYYQQWLAEVQEYNSSPVGMLIRKWCSLKGIKPPPCFNIRGINGMVVWIRGCRNISYLKE